MTILTGYKLTSNPGPLVVNTGAKVSDGAATESIDTAVLSPSHQVTVNFGSGGTLEGEIYLLDGAYYFTSETPVPDVPNGFGVITSVAEIVPPEPTPMVGTDEADVMVGDSVENTIMGGEGDDTLDGGAGDDVLYGGAGNDVLSGGTGDDTLVAGGDSGTTTKQIDPLVALNFEDGAGPVAQDDSGHAHDGIYQNGALPGATGWDGSGTGVRLDGVDDYVEIPDSAQFDLWEGTISIRFNADTLGGTLVSRDSKNFDDGGHVRLNTESDGSISIRIQHGSKSYHFSSQDALVSTGQWHHVALTFGSEGAKLYVDGAEAFAHDYSGGIVGNNEPWTLGADQGASGNEVADSLRDHFDGTLDEFGLFDVQLPADTIADIHTGGLGAATVPVETDPPGAILTLNFGDAGAPAGADDSGNGYDAILKGGATAGGSGWDGSGSGLVLDGVDDYAEIADSTAFDLSEGTVSIRFNAADASGGALFSRDSSSFDGGGHLTAMVKADGSLMVRIQDTSESHYITSDPGVVTPGEWHHVALSFGDDGLKLYLDGDAVGSHSYTGGTLGNNEPWVLGANSWSSGDSTANNLHTHFAGEIDEFALFNAQLSDAQIRSLETGGVDAVTFGPSGDSLMGGDGADAFLVAENFGGDTLVGGENSGDADLVDLSDLAQGVSVTFDGDEQGVVSNSTDTLSFAQIEAFTLTDAADQVDASQDAAGVQIFGGEGGDTIVGGTGDDLIEGGAGNDLLRTGLGQDTLLGGSGDDTLRNSAGDDLLVGGTGNDNLVATEGDDTLEGGEGDDTLTGGDDDDRLVGGTGDDSMTGDADADTFILEDGFGADTIIGGETATTGQDFDTVDLSAVTSPLTVTFTGPGAGTITDGVHTATFSEIERLILSEQADVVDASAETSGIEIVAAGGDDIVAGGQGADVLSAGSGADTLDGGAQDDTLSGGAGDDQLTGGVGDDVFTYAVGDGTDTITDFNTGNTGTLTDGDAANNDQIDLSGFYDHLSELYADQADDGVLNQSNTTNTWGDAVDYADNTQFGAADGLIFTGASADASFFTSENTNVVCFVRGTRIATARGPVPVEAIRPGDRVQTADNGLQPVVWVGLRALFAEDLARAPRLRPILVQPGSPLGNTVPLRVSPQHRFVLRKDRLGDRRGLGEAFVSAKLLVDTPRSRVRVARGMRRVVYVHLMTEVHQVIFAEGVATETFWPGPQALQALDPASRGELLTLFPGLTHAVGAPTGAVTERAYSLLARSALTRSDIATLHA